MPPARPHGSPARRPMRRACASDWTTWAGSGRTPRRSPCGRCRKLGLERSERASAAQDAAVGGVKPVSRKVVDTFLLHRTHFQKRQFLIIKNRKFAPDSCLHKLYLDQRSG